MCLFFVLFLLFLLKRYAFITSWLFNLVFTARFFIWSFLISVDKWTPNLCCSWICLCSRQKRRHQLIWSTWRTWVRRPQTSQSLWGHTQSGRAWWSNSRAPSRATHLQKSPGKNLCLPSAPFFWLPLTYSYYFSSRFYEMLLLRSQHGLGIILSLLDHTWEKKNPDNIWELKPCMVYNNMHSCCCR